MGVKPSPSEPLPVRDVYYPGTEALGPEVLERIFADVNEKYGTDVRLPGPPED